MKPIVAFDLDEVIVNLHDGTQAAMIRRFGAFPHWSQWQTYGAHLRLMSDDDFLQMIVEECLLEQATIEPGAAATVHEIQSMGFRAAAVTSRGYHPFAEQVTREHLERNDIYMDEIRIVPLLAGHGNKASTIKALGDVVAFIDDLPQNLWEVRDSGFSGVLCLNLRPWNAQECRGFKHWVNGVQYFPDELRSALQLAA